MNFGKRVGIAAPCVDVVFPSFDGYVRFKGLGHELSPLRSSRGRRRATPVSQAARSDISAQVIARLRRDASVLAPRGLKGVIGGGRLDMAKLVSDRWVASRIIPSCSNSLSSKIPSGVSGPSSPVPTAYRPCRSEPGSRAETKVPPGRLAYVHDRIGRLPGQDVADRTLGRFLGPASPLGIELAGGANHPQVAAALEQLIISQLPARSGRGDFLVGEVESHPGCAVGPTRPGLGSGQQRRLTGRHASAISGSVGSGPRPGWSVIPCSLWFNASSSSVMSRSHERAFHERSRCPSKILLIDRLSPRYQMVAEPGLAISSAQTPVMIYRTHAVPTTNGLVPGFWNCRQDRFELLRHKSRRSTHVELERSGQGQ